MVTLAYLITQACHVIFGHYHSKNPYAFSFRYACGFFVPVVSQKALCERFSLQRCKHIIDDQNLLERKIECLKSMFVFLTFSGAI